MAYIMNDYNKSIRPLILVTNDDGVRAPGLKAMVDAVKDLGEVIVVAPAQPQSGQSSALSVNKPLRINEHEDYNGVRIFSVTGTPVDCVKLGLHSIVSHKPDFLFSGINHGSNSGNAITYSGTMGAVIEGCTEGICSVGFSLLHHSLAADFSLSSELVKELATRVVTNPLSTHQCLNINIPAKVVPEGARVCRAAIGHWSEQYERYLDPQGKPFYWLTGRFINEEPNAIDTDEYWLSKNYISVVPVTPDQTLFSAIDPMSKVFNIS